ncbi:hypothetical protein QQ045_016915 [Rhodiola kirilowii]
MEQPASRRIKHAQVHKPDHQSAAGDHHRQINHRQFISRSASTKVESAAVTTTLKSHNKQPYHQPVHQDGQINSSSSKQLINKSQVWDCGSTLYDSFELNSFNLHLDKAINSSSSFRTLSMPHLPDRRAPLPPLPVMTITKHQPVHKKFNKVSKSFHKFLRSVFGYSNTINQGRSQESKLYRDVNHTGPNDPLNTKPLQKSTERKKDGFYVYDGSKSMRVLTTIPETQEINGQPKVSPDATPAVRRAVSERFTAATTVLV